MRKWTYLVAALLIGGTAATVTSCIENEEPAGITELRGAKAELLKAKAQVEAADAAYRMAETAWMQAKADYEAELAKQEAFKTQWHEAYTASEKQRIEQEMQLSAEQFKADLLAKQQATVQAQAEYDKAIIAIEAALVGYKESVYAAELQKLLNETYEVTYQGWYADDSHPAGGYWVTYRSTCYGLTNLSQQIASSQQYIAQYMRYKAALEFSYDVNTKIAATEGQLAIEKGTLAGLEKQLENLKVLQGKPFEEWDAQYKVYEEQKKTLGIQKTNLALAEKEALKPILEKETANTAAYSAKSELVFTIPAEIQDDFYRIDNIFGGQAIQDAEGDYSYPNGVKDMMTMYEKANALDNLLSDIENNYIISDNELEQANRQLAQYKAIDDNNQDYYTNTLLPAWETALETYKTLYDAGKYFASGINDRDVIIKEYETYNNLPATTAAQITAKETARKAFAAKLKVYLTQRVELDGFKIVKTADPTKVIDPTVDADWDQWVAIGNATGQFGNSTPDYGGAYKAYVDAANKMGYVSATNPANGRCVEYTYEEYLENGGFNNNLWNNSETKVIFENRRMYESLKSAIENKPSWDKLYADLKALYDANGKAQNDLQLLINTVAAEREVIESDYDAQEAAINVQLAGIDDIMNVIRNVISGGSSYSYDYALQLLKEQIAALESGTVSGNGNDFSFGYGSIPAQKAVIAKFEKLLAALKDGSYKPAEDAQIVYYQAMIDTYQNRADVLTALFNAASKKKDQLLAALAGTSAQ